VRSNNVTGWAAEKYRQHPLFGLIVRLGGGIFIRRGEVDRDALVAAVAWLQKGNIFGVAPEGTRSPNRALQEAHNGLAYIAHRSQAAIVPVAITGSPAFAHHIKRLRRTPVHVQLGKPFYLRADRRQLDRETMSAMTDEAMYQLAALLPPDYRGVYAALERATENYIQFLDDTRSNLPPAGQRVRPRGVPAKHLGA